MKPSTENINISLDTNGFPMDGVPDKIKNEREYGKKFAEAIYSYWNGAKWGGAMRFGNNVGWNGIRDWYDEKRAYMFGMQDPAKYDRKFSLPQGQDGVEGDGQTGVNFDRRVFQIANKYMRILVSMMTDSQPVLEVNPGDVFSTDKMQERKYLDLSKIINKPIIMAAQAAIGIEPQESPEQPQSPDEVILYEMLGGYKPSFALAMQTALQASLNVVNDFEEVLYDIVQKDIIPVGLAATSTHMDSGGIVRFERVAPEDLIIPFSDKNDFSDMPWVGRIRMLTMTELKQKAGNEFTDEEYDHIEHTCLTSSWTPIKNQNRVMTGDANVSSRGIPCLEFQFYTATTIPNDPEVLESCRSGLRLKYQYSGSVPYVTVSMAACFKDLEGQRLEPIFTCNLQCWGGVDDNGIIWVYFDSTVARTFYITAEDVEGNQSEPVTVEASA